MEGALRPGAILLGKYRVESVLGRGGMGVVVKVTHLQLGEELAIKLLSPEGATSPEVTARFLREAQSVVRLRGEHVAKVTDVGVLPEGLPYMVMEYLRGVDLAGELKRRTLLAPGEAVDYVLQACEALAEAHGHGIIHRDIKPANLFLTTRPDGTPLLKVLDFGISKAPITASGVVTRTDIVMGTAGYMSPEQMKAARGVDGRTDIWALGIVLYECLSGRRPFEGESFSAVVLKAGTEPPPPMDPRIPRGLQDVVLRCLEKDRSARYSSIAELATELAPFALDQRAAAMVVDRTNLMRQRSGGRAAPPPPPPQHRAPTATTLSGSAGPIGSRSRRRRYALVGAVSVIGSIAILSAVVHTASAPERAPAGRAAVSSVPADAPSDEKTQRLAMCADLVAQKRWRDVVQCSTGLQVLGLEAQTQAFRDKAAAETRNEAIDGNARQAIRDGDLRTAQSLLRQISADSVYLDPLRAVFDRADAGNVEDARRRARDFVNAHDCAGLKAYLAQLQPSAAGSERALDVVKDAVTTCTETSPPEPLIAGSNAGGGSHTPCNAINVDDLLRQAANQYAAGFAATALSSVSRALTCRQSVHMYQLAGLYACAARDLANARVYFARTPVGQQSGIEQRCQQEGLNIRGP